MRRTQQQWSCRGSPKGGPCPAAFRPGTGSSVPPFSAFTQATALRTFAVPTTGGVRLLCVRRGILDAWTNSATPHTSPAGAWTGAPSSASSCAPGVPG
ncbi:hypothetical protein StrepF001_34030 [Streptomyces sp. F001]|nr:hypothetical protein StrepF001_34030 [Streptomyces sp. F001]